MKHRLNVYLFLILLSLVTLLVYVNNQPAEQITMTEAQTAAAPTTTVVAKNLEIPWALAFLPDGNILVTERPGKVKLVTTATGQVADVATIAEVKHIGEGGLLGITLHPQFASNNFVYVYYTYSGSGSNTLNRVVRYTYTNNQFSAPTTIVDAIPGGTNHDGGRIKFGPDGFLYITTGEAGNPSLAQDTNSLAGKILRVTDAGQPAPGNPFNSPVYTYGNRNPQGLAWNGSTLYATEHGNSSPSRSDELNLIEAGKNYGWPTIEGDAEQAGMVKPLVHSGNDSSTTWAPSGTAFFNGSVFFSGLKGQALYEAKVQGATATIVNQHFKGQLGRLREAIVGPDNQLYITTSNRDGRGSPKAEDDKILRVSFGAASPQTSPPAAPSFYPLAPCPTCSSPSVSPVISSGAVIPTSGTTVPTSPVANPSPSMSPCDASVVAEDNHKPKKKHKKHSGNISNIFEKLLELILKLITMLLGKSGELPAVSPGPSTSPEPSSSPC